jgi:hypothetical protein
LCCATVCKKLKALTCVVLLGSSPTLALPLYRGEPPLGNSFLLKTFDPVYSYASSMTGLADEEDVLLTVTPPGE